MRPSFPTMSPQTAPLAPSRRKPAVSWATVNEEPVKSTQARPHLSVPSPFFANRCRVS
ncbi:hypothetical protein B0T16DRAFT_406271 [Cercophora newfieldiana]|uniref:Uncharacterized protein n=1 Tax=Cercophora newfieldiana TaxID=92897 RepID=A0AA39YH74_9PEZI|nr:hypothetical protein B0T16DRAFT_406271 [Cercophora newfieldiana]